MIAEVAQAHDAEALAGRRPVEPRCGRPAAA